MKYVFQFALVGLLAGLPAVSSAAVFTDVTQHNHDNTNNPNPALRTSPFFNFVNTAIGGTAGSTALVPANGIGGDATQGSSVSNVTGTLSFVGNSSIADNFTTGNGIPIGVTLKYDIAFQVSGQVNGVDGFLSTRDGNTGRGLGIAVDDATDFDAIDVNDTVIFSSLALTNVMAEVDAAAIEPNVSVSNVQVDDVAFVALRVADFQEEDETATLSNNTLTNSYGGTDFVLQNDLDDLFTPISLVGNDVVLENTGGDGFHLKGFALESTLSFDITAVPEPGSLSALVVCGAGVVMRRRRKNKALKIA